MTAKAPATPTAQPTLDQFLDTMKRRKVLWEFHLGTVGGTLLTSQAIAPAGAGSSVDFPVTLDGDTQSIPAQSLAGNLQIGQRVAVIFVPPASYNVVSVLGSAQNNAVLDAVAVTTVGALTGAASAATAIPQLELRATVVAGRTYMVTVQVFLPGTVATDVWGVSASQSAVGGAGIGTGAQLSGTSPTIQWPWTPAVSGPVDIVFSFARVSGTGTATAFGSPGAGVIRTSSMIEDVTSVWRTA